MNKEIVAGETPEGDTSIPPQAMKWMQEEGLMMQMILIPKIQSIDLPGQPAGTVDKEQVQLITQMQTKTETQFVHSGHVGMNKEEVKQLLQAQFEQNLEGLLEHHFREAPEQQDQEGLKVLS